MTDLAVQPAPPPRPHTPTPGRLTVDMRKVSRRFGEVDALRDLDLAVPEGRITVLLGPNGAGKTTAIRMITGALPPDSGTVTTFGVDPRVDGEAVRARCGVVAAKPSLYDRLSGRDNLAYAAALYSVGADSGERIHAAAARFGIDHALDQMVGGYSTGMKTRLALARAVLHDPALLLLDEPTSGLDPESSHAVLAMIRELTSDGRTVVMCTHLLAEAEGLADQVVMLEDGTDLLTGSQAELIATYWPTPALHIEAVGAPPVVQVERMGLPMTVEGRSIRVEVPDLDQIPQVVRNLVGQGVDLMRVEPERPSLEDLYFRIRRTRDGEVLR